LQAVFAGLYFDAQNHLRKVAAHEPFDELLSCSKKTYESIILEKFHFTIKFTFEGELLVIYPQNSFACILPS